MKRVQYRFSPRGVTIAKRDALSGSQAGVNSGMRSEEKLILSYEDVINKQILLFRL